MQTQRLKFKRFHKVNDALDGGIGTVIGGFEPAVGTVLRVWLVMERLLASGPQRRLWKNRKSRATWMPFCVRRKA